MSNYYFSNIIIISMQIFDIMLKKNLENFSDSMSDNTNQLSECNVNYKLFTL